jgi:HK97 family phage prohead protease
MTMDHETRYLPLADAEVRAETTEGGKPLIRGVALRYGSPSVRMSDSKGRPFTEKFAPGAFTRALAAGADVRALVNHDRNLVLGRSTAGTLRLMDDGDALRFEIDPPDTVIADHYVNAVKRGDMSGMSFRFYKRADKWSGAGEGTVREVTEADIDDVSIVTYPAYPDTEAATRSLDDHHRDHPATPDPVPLAWRSMARNRLRLADAE